MGSAYFWTSKSFKPLYPPLYKRGEQNLPECGEIFTTGMQLPCH